MAISIIFFLIIFCVIVVSHELGHFLVAKKNGIHVMEFFIGMGPTLLSFTRGDTKYSLKLLPIGGACVFEGEDGLAAEKGELSEGAFPNAPVWGRFATVLAGPLFNFLIAYLMALILVTAYDSTTTEIVRVEEGSRAEEAGLMVGDVITRINGRRVYLNAEVTFASMTNSDGLPMEVTFTRNGQEHTVVITPAYSEENQRYYLGISSGRYLECNVLQTFQHAFYIMRYYVHSTYKSLQMLVTGRLSRDQVAGPVGLVKVVDETYDYYKDTGAMNVVLSMMEITLLLSVNLGIMNLLPLPALDGGRLVFLLLEAIRGKPIPPEKEGLVHMAGMMALMVLMVVVLFNDITKFF